MYKDNFIKDCFLVALNLISNMEGIKDTSYLYIPYLGFDYDVKNLTKNDVGSRIVNRWDGKWGGGSYWILNNKTFLKIELLHNPSLYKCKELLQAGKSLMIWSDVYHCPWTMFYHKRNFRHVYVITDTKDNRFICQDEFFGIKNYEFICEKAYQNFDSVSLVNIYQKNMELYEIKKQMLFFLEKYEGTIKKAYKNFSIGLLSMDVADQHVADNNYYGNMILTKMKNMSRYRYGYANFLKNLSKDYGVNLMEVSQSIENLAELWSHLVFILLKLFIKNKQIIYNDPLMSIIDQISSEEQEALLQLIHFCRNE